MDRTIVVGASAAGLYAAERLASAGRDVTVVERRPRVDMAPRTLIVTDRMIDILGPGAAAAVVNQVRRFELIANGSVGMVELERPDLVIERSLLVAYLEGRARAGGARFVLGARVTDIDVSGEAISVGIKHDGTQSRLRGRVLVGADGARSRVATRCGWSHPQTVPLVQAIVELPEDSDPETSKVWFRPRETPYFLWSIPEGDGRAAVGIIGTGRSDVRPILDGLLEREGLKAIEHQGAVIPVFDRWVPFHRSVPGGDVYLVGDAAGQVKISTVGGIVTGFRGAAAVVDSILGRGRRSAWGLRRELAAHALIRRSLNRFEEEDYGVLISRLQGDALSSLAAGNRDEAVKLLFRFGRARPGIALKAVATALSRA